MKEIRIHGRGGQGAVTTGKIIASAAFFDGAQSQAFPMFGVERSGAPVSAFARISSEKINLRSQVYLPDFVIVLDPSLLDSVNVLEGLKKDGKVIINSNKSKKELGLDKPNVYVVDATLIAEKIFKKPFVNTTILGAFAKISGSISLKSLEKAIDELLLKKGKDVAEKNKKAVREAFERIR